MDELKPFATRSYGLTVIIQASDALYSATRKMKNKFEVIQLLKSYGITKFAITDIHYGNSLTYGPLKKLIIREDRFIHLPEEFNRLGYGISYGKILRNNIK